MTQHDANPELRGRNELLLMAETLHEEERLVAATAGMIAVNARRLPRPGTVSVIPGTAKRIEYHRGFTLVNHGNPPSDVHDYPIRRLLELHPELWPEATTSEKT
jgi:hypothetical protein